MLPSAMGSQGAIVRPNEWLLSKPYGYADLTDLEREAIMHFSLLWGLFEGVALRYAASPKNIRRLVERWAHQGRLNKKDFAESFAYFAQRYFVNGNPTHHFAGLNLRNNDLPDLMEAVLKGENTNLIDEITVLLMIVYRLRNNLFHGLKWDYGIRDQFDNFIHANVVLMKSVDLC